ncbi:MAG TPA: hypothetical protein PLK37_16010 [Terricaulis sp.]|nr:hypothetical protein [Terricaulis sp.]
MIALALFIDPFLLALGAIPARLRTLRLGLTLLFARLVRLIVRHEEFLLCPALPKQREPPLCVPEKTQ